MNLVILSEKDEIGKNEYQVFDNRYLHIKNILKKNPEDHLEIGILNEIKGKAKIKKYTEKSVILELVEEYKFEILSQIELDIICALPRPQTLKKILPLIATTGIRNLHLIKSNRVEKSFFHSPLVNEKEKIEKYLLEGLSQGKRIDIPTVKVFSKFKDYFENDFRELIAFESKETLKILAHPETNSNLYNLFNVNENKIKRVIAAIGPEGGWVPYEIDFLEDFGFKKISLGSSVLRVENAVNAIISQKELLEIIK